MIHLSNHRYTQSTICFATNATMIAKNINATRIKINIHVCSVIQPRNDDCEQLLATAALLVLTVRITAGVENVAPVLYGPVSVILEPVSSLVCRMAYTRTW